MSSGPTTKRGPWVAIRRWFDNDAAEPDLATADPDRDRVDWLRCVPFLVMHAGCLLVLVAGVSPIAIALAVFMYAARMFAITGFYHRYFSHRAFRTSRPTQFAFAVLGAASAQRGPIWWAAHHRLHHRRSDTAEDSHSPVTHGLLWSHMGWFLCKRHFRTPAGVAPDFERYPELRFLDRYDTVVPVILALVLLAAGEALAAWAPGLGTNGLQLLAWGFFVSTVVLFHATFTINSVAHRIGRRRFDTPDQSRNNSLLALLTFGEGWHNNHHHHPHSARQGFRWWEIDLTWYGLVVLSWLGVVWDLRPVPAELRR